MYDQLSGIRIIEASSFVASPLAGLYLAQLGADVIRVDHIGGGPDFNRWPKSRNGRSFYWEGLNAAKRSLALDLKSVEAKELLKTLVTRPGKDSGILLTNYPANGFLSYENLREQRSDVIVVRVMGRSDGRPAVDYTVNCSVGMPQITGPATCGDTPVNHVLPAWDLLTGAYAAFALLAALRKRQDTGRGGEVRVPLSDIAVTTIANLGQVAEVLESGQDRKRYGNDVFGAFGRDFLTSDGKRLMIVAVTRRQWIALIKVLRISEEIESIEHDLDVSFETDEGQRFIHREVLVPLIADRVRERSAMELIAALEIEGGCWGEYKTTYEMANDLEMVSNNPVFTQMPNVSGFTYPIPGAPATLLHESRQPARRAPALGEHSLQVLQELLGLTRKEAVQYVKSGVVGISNN